MKCHVWATVFSLAAVALALTASKANAALQPNQSNLTNVVSGGGQDSGATGIAALTGLNFEYTYSFFDPRGHLDSWDVYSATLTATCTGLTPGANYVFQCQFLVPSGGYQLVKYVEVTADESGTASATFDILVAKKWSIPVSVSRDIGTPQPYAWQDTVTPVLQGWVAPKGG